MSCGFGAFAEGAEQCLRRRYGPAARCRGWLRGCRCAVGHSCGPAVNCRRGVAARRERAVSRGPLHFVRFRGIRRGGRTVSSSTVRSGGEMSGVAPGLSVRGGDIRAGLR